MKLKLAAALVMGIAVSHSFAATEGSSAQLSTDMDKLSYSIGADLGKNFKKQGIEISPQAMSQGISDGLSGGQLMMTDDQMKEALSKFQQELMAKRNAAYAKRAENNKTQGANFLEENKSKPGVVTLPSGLQYKILTAGNGAKPTKSDSVTVEYTGHLINGEVFDSTDKSGKPATFNVTQVIPGWTEALQLMPAGSTWEIYVPASLAYGERSMGGPIGPNETLIFKIHLISVNKPNA